MGISGDNTSGLLERFDFETRDRIDEDQETAFVFAIGVNDSQFVEKQGHRIPIDQFLSNLKTLIDKARKYSKKIVFVGLFPVDDSKLTPTSWDQNKSYTLEYVAKYNDVLQQVCKSEEIDFINTYDKFVNKDFKELLIDGLHLNTEGHKQLSNIVLKFLHDKMFI